MTAEKDTAKSESAADKPLIVEHKAAYEDAVKARQKIEAERDDFLNAKRQEARAAADGLFGNRIAASSAVEHNALEVLENALEQLALSGKDAPHPIGTILVEWARPAYRSRTRWPMALTGRRAIIEVITADSKHPQNLSRWARAQRGAVVARLIKKDGAGSAKYISSSFAIKNYWFPDGVDPNEKDAQ